MELVHRRAATACPLALKFFPGAVVVVVDSRGAAGNPGKCADERVVDRSSSDVHDASLDAFRDVHSHQLDITQTDQRLHKAAIARRGHGEPLDGQASPAIAKPAGPVGTPRYGDGRDVGPV